MQYVSVFICLRLCLIRYYILSNLYFRYTLKMSVMCIYIYIDIHIIVIYVILHMSFLRDVSACQTASQILFISSLPRSFHGFLMYIIY